MSEQLNSDVWIVIYSDRDGENNKLPHTYGFLSKRFQAEEQHWILEVNESNKDKNKNKLSNYVSYNEGGFFKVPTKIADTVRQITYEPAATYLKMDETFVKLMEKGQRLAFDKLSVFLIRDLCKDLSVSQFKCFEFSKVLFVETIIEDEYEERMDRYIPKFIIRSVHPSMSIL